MSQRFKRRIEDFICENCGKKVNGDGYTNHCPFCLWSKHVDVFPGDRSSLCNGMMIPKRIETRKRKNIIIHKCLICGYEKKNKISEKDNYDLILKICNNY